MLHQRKFVYFLLIVFVGLVLAACSAEPEVVEKLVVSDPPAEVAQSSGSEDEAIQQPNPPRDKTDATGTDTVAQADTQSDTTIDGIRAQTEPTSIPQTQNRTSTWVLLLTITALIAGGGFYTTRG